MHLKESFFGGFEIFLSSLKSLGFSVEIREEERSYRRQLWRCDPKERSRNLCGSAGTAARFLTAMLALSEGVYTIQASEQMKRRPMRPLFEALEQSGAEFTYLEKRVAFFPVRVRGKPAGFKEASLDISRQYPVFSALLMMAPVLGEDFTIHITSEKKDGSYIRITRKMMEQFGVECNFDGDSYHIKRDSNIKEEVYEIEPDVSWACYFMRWRH